MACLEGACCLCFLSIVASGVLVGGQGSSLLFVPQPTALPMEDERSIDVLAPYKTVETLPQQMSTLVQASPEPNPTPAAFFSGDGSSGDDGYFEPSDVTTTFIPDLAPTTTQPQPDVVVRLKLSFDDGGIGAENATVETVIENLSEVVGDILELSVAPDVSQESGDTFIVSIVTSSSTVASVLRGDLSTIADKLASQVAARIRGIDGVEVLSIMRYGEPPLTTNHRDFPLWQWFIYAVCAVIVTTAMLLLLLACCHRCAWKRNQQSRSSRRYQGYRHLLLTKHRPEEMVDFAQEPSDQEHDLAMSRKVSRITFRPRGPMQLLSHPLTPEELEDFTINQLAVHMEYSTIPSNMVTMAEVPPGAEEKNRFKDVLPNPQTRVALFLKFAVPNSDYINANYIRGYRNTPKAYIATQGPLYWTVADFWRMIWEQKCSTIIMVTGLEEKGINKCARYWPNERIQHMTSYEDLELILKRKTSNKNYTTTTFHLRHKQKLVTREVTHFWFTAWPDHGVPGSARPVVEFLLKARHHLRDIPGPTVVHCSAGIGRTGVFIGAEIGMQQLEEKGEVDILKIVSTLRQDRGGMVQTKEQYHFLYQVLVEYSKYLEELRSPYKTAEATAVSAVEQRVPAARQPWAGFTRLDPPREEDRESDSTI